VLHEFLYENRDELILGNSYTKRDVLLPLLYAMQNFAILRKTRPVFTIRIYFENEADRKFAEELIDSIGKNHPDVYTMKSTEFGSFFAKPDRLLDDGRNSNFQNDLFNIFLLKNRCNRSRGYRIPQ